MNRGSSRDRALFAAAVVVNLVVLYWPGTAGDPGVPYLDKVVHLLVFAAVAWTGVRLGIPLGWLAGILVAHAVVSELAQHWVLSERTGDPADVVADLGGVAIGLIGGSWRHGRARDDRGADRSTSGRDPCTR